MVGSNETLKDRLARYRQIKLIVIGRKSGKTISIPRLVRAGRRKVLPPARAGARTLSGTRTFSRTRRFGLMRGVWKKSCEPFPSLMQIQSNQ
jgi:hypothetical protein